MDAKSQKLDESIQCSTSQDGERPTTSINCKVDSQQKNNGQDTKCRYTKPNTTHVDSNQNNFNICSCTNINAFALIEKPFSGSRYVYPEIENNKQN